MARIDNLSNFCTDVANAIRSKTGKNELITPANYDIEIESIPTGTPSLQEKNINITSNNDYIITPDSNYDGLNKVNINVNVPAPQINLQSKTTNPSTSQQVIEADSNYDGLDKVTINAIQTESKNVKSTTIQQTITPTINKFINEVVVEPIELENINVTPTTSSQVITPSQNKDGINQVNVSAINLQDKSVEITTNTTTNISADSGYDGLGQVSVTTNVPSININDYEMSTITENPLPSSTTGAIALIKRLPPNFRIDDNITSGNLMFRYCKNLIEIPDGFNTGNLTTASSMFQRCESLENVPVLDLSSITGKALGSMFSSCFSLTDNSLNNIMQSLLSVTTNYTGAHTLKTIGINEEQATRCQSLSNYQALIEAGWTTGY